MSTSTPLQVVLARVPDRQPAARRPHPLLDRQRSLEEGAGQRARRAEVRVPPLEHDLAAGAARARPHVHDVVGDPDHVGVVLDDDHRVALVAQLHEQLVEAVHVARVEPDARLVEDVGDVDQAAAEVLDHLDPLRLAARQRVGLAVQAEVVEPDVDDVAEPLEERGEDRPAHLAVVHQPQDRDEVADRHRGQVGDRVAVDPRAQRRLVQPGAAAGRADPRAEVRLDGLLHPLRERLDVAPDVGPLDLLEHADVRGVHRLVADRQLVLAVLAPQEQVHLLRGVVAQLLVVVEEARRRVRADLPADPHRHLDRALVERLVEVQEVVRDDRDLAAQAVALGAHARSGR